MFNYHIIAIICDSALFIFIDVVTFHITPTTPLLMEQLQIVA